MTGVPGARCARATPTTRRWARPRRRAPWSRCAASTASRCADGLAAHDPAAAVKPPTPAKRLPKALPLSDVEAILEAAGAPGTTLALRDRALLEVLYGTGARISEAVGLDVDDLDAPAGRPTRRGARCCCAARAARSGWCRSAPTPGRRCSAYLVARPARAGRPPARGTARAVPQRPRRPALAAVGLDGAGAGRRAGRRHPRRLAPHAAALLRHPPARRRRRRAGGAGAAGPRLGDHHAGLHAGHRRQPARGLRHRPPPGPG